jgi:hypothetical protein
MKKLYSWDEINCEIVEMTASEMRAANEQTGWEFGKRYKNGVRLDNGGHFHIALSVRAESKGEASAKFEIDPTYRNMMLENGDSK